jgi:Kelch motif
MDQSFSYGRNDFGAMSLLSPRLTERFSFSLTPTNSTFINNLSTESLRSKTILLDQPPRLYIKLLQTIEFLEAMEVKIQRTTKDLIFKITSEANRSVSAYRKLKSTSYKILQDFLSNKRVNSEDLKIISNIKVSNPSYINIDTEKIHEAVSLFYKNQSDINNLIEEFDTNKICFFDRNSTKLNVIDLFEDDLSINLDISDKLCFTGGTCQLPNDSFFYYGGWPSDYTDVVYTVNLSDLTVSKKKNRNSKAFIGCVYHNNSVYCFGGVKNKKLDEAEKYNLASDTWEKLSKIPKQCSNISCSLYQNSILFTGQGVDNLYLYDIARNKYFKCAKFESKSRKLVFACEKIYLFESGKLHETTSGGCEKFSLINGNTGVPDKALIGYPVKYQLHIYFLLYDGNVYRFSPSTKEVKVVKYVKILNENRQQSIFVNKNKD